MKGKSRAIYNQLKKSYRLSVTDKATFVEVFSVPVSKLKFYIAVLSVFLIGFLIAMFLLFYTPLKVIIPGFPSNRTREMIVKNARAIDSLELELQKRDQFLDKIKSVISGEIITDTVTYRSDEIEEIKLKPMHSDTIFNELIAPDNYKFSPLLGEQDLEQLNRMNLFTPFNGLVINKFNASPGHFGTDVVGRSDGAISAILEGTVIFAEWSFTTGYVIIIQHNFNLISVYKHNAKIFVKNGDRVKTGELIAIVGNEGEYSTGPHLHLEMWQNGIPLNPENYFNFRDY